MRRKAVRNRPRARPWYHRISPLTWALLWILLAASVSFYIGVSRRAAKAVRAPQVQVLNGCGTAGLARAVAERLRDGGLDVVAVGNADATNYDETLVLLRRGELSVARRVARILGLGRALEQRDTTLLVDVTVILGRDYVRAHPSSAATH